MYYFIYKTTNKINGKYYVGKHKTDNIDDEYLGSGTILKRAIKKYGKENFIFEIIEYCETEEKLNIKEMEYITEDMVKSKNCYNLKLGGNGGFDHINNCSENKKRCVEKAKLTCSNWSKEYKKEVNAKKSNYGKSNGMYGSSRSGELAPMYGKTHTKEAKKKMSLVKMGKIPTEKTRKKMSKSQKDSWGTTRDKKKHGKVLSEYYKNNPETKKSISEKISKKKWFNNGVKNKRCEVHPGDGWTTGRLPFKKEKQ